MGLDSRLYGNDTCLDSRSRGDDEGGGREITYLVGARRASPHNIGSDLLAHYVKSLTFPRRSAILCTFEGGSL